MPDGPYPHPAVCGHVGYIFRVWSRTLPGLPVGSVAEGDLGGRRECQYQNPARKTAGFCRSKRKRLLAGRELRVDPRRHVKLPLADQYIFGS